MPEPVEVRLLFFVDREGTPWVRVNYNGVVGPLYLAYEGAHSVLRWAEGFEDRIRRVRPGAVSEPLNDEKGGTP